MSSETRIIRPFKSALNTQTWFDENLELHLRDGNESIEIVEPGSTARVEASQLLRRSVFLTGLGQGLFDAISSDAKQIYDGDFSKLSLILVAQSRYLKRTEIVRCISSLDFEVLPQEISLNSNIFRCVHNGWDVIVALVISEEIERFPGRAWRQGTWLAKAEFKLASPAEGLGFTPRPLTDSVRSRYGLSPKSTRYAVVVDGQSIFDGSTVDDVMEYYVDEALMKDLSNKSSTAFSVLEQVRIFQDAANFIVNEAARAEEFKSKSIEDLSESIVGKFLILIAGDDRDSQKNWLRIWQTKPSRIIAAIEEHIDLAGKLNKALESIS